MEPRQLLEDVWWAGVRRVSGHEAVAQALAVEKPGAFTHIAAVGKAAGPMMQAALSSNGADTPALLVTKYDHVGPELSGGNLEIIESAHPVPDENSLRAGKALIEFVSHAGTSARLLLLVSGGASALAESLPEGMTLDDLQAMNRQMLADGLDIHAINAKRKEVSQIKAGKLLSRFSGNSALVLLISDVEGDAIPVIGSGIGEIPDTRRFEDFEAEIVASNAIARDACERRAEDLGIEVIVNSESLYGDVFEVAGQAAKTILPGAPGLYVFGGEPVTVLPDDPGEGGRNQALAVAFAREVAGAENIFCLVAGTDGSDGPTGSAGGYVSGKSWQKTGGGSEALATANSGEWLRRSGGLFVTGPTGTNVMDLMLVLKTS